MIFSDVTKTWFIILCFIAVVKVLYIFVTCYSWRLYPENTGELITLFNKGRESFTLKDTISWLPYFCGLWINALKTDSFYCCLKKSLPC